jgi:acetyltransferase-like isoleucine patch superfamily enzyme
MKNYGTLRPVASIGMALAKGGARLLRAAYQQKRFIVGRNVKIHYDVTFFGSGAVILNDGVTVERGAAFYSEENAVIDIGSGSWIGPHSVLMARKNQPLRLGRNFGLGARSRMTSAAGILWGDNGNLGGESFVGPREDAGAGRLTVGVGTHLNNNALVDLCADVNVGDNVHTGPYCALYTHNHVAAAGKLIWEQQPTFSPINIGSGVWIGHNCCFLPGTAIGDHSVLASGAVVTKLIESWVIAGGVPARVLKGIV